MQELQLTNQMEIIGGGVGTWIVCVVVGAAVYKMLYSSSGLYFNSKTCFY